MGCMTGLLVKDNHIAAVPMQGSLAPFSEGHRRSFSRAEDGESLCRRLKWITLEQLREVLKVDGIDVILLDNMDCPQMATAVVELRNQAGASGHQHYWKRAGGVTIETVRQIAQTGVERISVGALTHIR